MEKRQKIINKGISEVEKYYNLVPGCIKSGTRQRFVSKVRYTLAYYYNVICGFPQEEICKYFGWSQRSSISNVIGAHEKRMDDGNYKILYTQIVSILTKASPPSKARAFLISKEYDFRDMDTISQVETLLQEYENFIK